ncbi:MULTISPECIES: hypothetical protein [Streptomyces]|uniref:Ferric oxidoreductase domain-containing protein n=1 Tax=Streptomyces glycanivorans TaxID=3033808 RepID=A0ABY9JFN3_9ACTN|nr:MULTISPECIES: hypothetical protein [unclassified Streptomyces]WLQ66512.1 hypothetical protein P8A20_24360 [Streptomyces sp. Alt3]WSQ79961.1 hypothetical protein OG725_23955 [Streptomyces sp. NBC_01213]WSR50620.1 hypothetical protein OG279_24645 [Streptomyces sp. NBC_01201]
MKPHRRIRSSSSLSSGPGTSRPLQGGLTVAALVLIPLLAVAGSDGMRATFDFTTGVLTLVSLTAAVGWGLLATDRVFLSTRQRLVCQGIHRAAAVASLGFLLLHGTVKVALGHVGPLGALIPFGAGVSGTAGLIGFGSLAGLLMIVAAATGAMRSAFATPGRIAGRWRALHALAYPAWCAALVHGLYAGRQPATWVVVMYMLCLTAVAAALALRLLPVPAKRLLTELVTSLTGPDAPPSASDPVIRSSPLPGAESAPALSGRGLPPGAPGWGDDRGVRGTPVRPRTLAAPETPGALPHEPTEYASQPFGRAPQGLQQYEAPPYGSPPLYEPPPRSSERLAPGTFPAPAPGASQGSRTGNSAAYRAVSRASGPPPGQTDDRWPSPSPAPPPQTLMHAYAPPPESAPASASDPVTEQLPGPLCPPSAGEPWNAPAGDRP